MADEVKPEAVPTIALSRRAVIASAGLIGGVSALGLKPGEHMAKAVPAPATVENFGIPPDPDASWKGVDMLQGGKGYVAAPLGQLHYRDVGPRNARYTMLLLHQTSASIIEFGAIQNSLAKLGIRSAAPDMPNHGMSDQVAVRPTIGGLADNFLHLLDQLKLDKVVVVGHHTGSCTATAMAARHPDRISGIVLHGCCLYTPDEMAAMQTAKELDHSPKPDGTHLLWLFQVPFPRDTRAKLDAWTQMTVMDFMEGPDIGHYAIARYDMGKELEPLKQPGLIITELEDKLHPRDVKAHELRPDFTLKVLGATNHPAIFTDPEGWAKIASEWMASSIK